MKMPEPIMLPATSIVLSNSPRRCSRPVAVVGGSAVADIRIASRGERVGGRVSAGRGGVKGIWLWMTGAAAAAILSPSAAPSPAEGPTAVPHRGADPHDPATPRPPCRRPLGVRGAPTGSYAPDALVT